MQKFNNIFTKALIVFTKFSDKECQIINLIKSSEIAVIILMIFTITLIKTLSYYILNYITNIYGFFSYKKFLTLIVFTFTDKVSLVNIFRIIHFRQYLSL